MSPGDYGCAVTGFCLAVPFTLNMRYPVLPGRAGMWGGPWLGLVLMGRFCRFVIFKHGTRCRIFKSEVSGPTYGCHWTHTSGDTPCYPQTTGHLPAYVHARLASDQSSGVIPPRFTTRVQADDAHVVSGP